MTLTAWLFTGAFPIWAGANHSKIVVFTTVHKEMQV